MGHRIAKHVYSSDNIWEKSTFYVLDGTGNVMSVYERVIDNTAQTITFEQTEKYIYGASRLGVLNSNINLLGSAGTAPYTQTTFSHHIGKRNYFLENHLGNVLSVISDKVIPHSSNGTTVDYYLADILQSTDYSPFGVELSGRTLSKSGLNDFARYSFQGQEHDDEVKGNGNSVNYKYRMHDPRLGRFFAVDPLAAGFPWNSPYAFSENDLISCVELEGLEKVGYQSRPGADIVWHDYTGDTDKEIERALGWTYKYHQGNLTLEDVKAMKDKDYVLVTNYVDTYCNSTGTGIEHYSSRNAFFNGKPFKNENIKDISQWLYAKDASLEGPRGMVPGLKLMAATVGTILSGGTLAAGGTATWYGTTFVVTNFIFNVDNMTAGTSGQTLLESMGEKVGGKTGEQIVKFTKLTVSIVDTNRGLHTVAATLGNGDKVIGEWDAINNIWNSFDVVKSVAEEGSNTGN